ncbi:tyrosine-type recombinase/integrase [Peribacillus asahii]|uniref:tyrosine-type recombinase/integrase n=1 Tax=Peribacillus asahii TaxID=228899 RepID=UPI0038175D60
MRLAYLNEKLTALIKKHGFHEITIHGLRHTHASLLFEAGASIKEVQKRLGAFRYSNDNEHLYTCYRLSERANSGKIPKVY